MRSKITITVPIFLAVINIAFVTNCSSADFSPQSRSNQNPSDLNSGDIKGNVSRSPSDRASDNPTSDASDINSPVDISSNSRGSCEASECSGKEVDTDRNDPAAGNQWSIHCNCEQIDPSVDSYFSYRYECFVGLSSAVGDSECEAFQKLCLSEYVVTNFYPEEVECVQKNDRYFP